MLILSRKPHESIRIGKDIEITVNEIRGGRVRLAIKAPDEVKILRTELDSPGPQPPRRLVGAA